MIVIRFANAKTKTRAISFLVGRFPGKTWSTGELAVPDSALADLAIAGFQFNVLGATGDQGISNDRPISGNTKANQ